MKAITLISRVGQIVILAIAFIACVGWNRAAGLQNNISSISQKRIKDIVRVRYVLPYTNLHTVPEPCFSDAAFDNQTGTKNLNKWYVWNSSESPVKKDAESCKATQSLFLNQTKTNDESFVLPAFCQSKLDIADAFHGQGYFSGFAHSLASVYLTNYTVQENVNGVSAAAMDTGTTGTDANNLNDINEYLADGSTLQSTGILVRCPTK